MNKKQRNALITIAIGAAIWFAPVPAGVTVVAWHLAAVFIATVVGFILQPLPIGAVAFIAITFSTLSGLLKVSDALSGYGNSTIWLIVCAFLYSRGFIKSGLGKRIAFGIIKAIGKSALSLGYAIAFSELIISPATPSATARGGGIMYPIVRSLAGALGSEPNETAKKIGTYLMQVGYHCDAVTCTMFVTSMAGNPLCVALAAKTLGVEITWMGWASAAIVPGLLSLLLVPLVMLKLTKPELVSIPDAKHLAQKELDAMGPMSRSEKVLFGVFIMLLALWATASFTHLNATLIALMGLCILLCTRVLKWSDVTGEKKAWDTLIWVGGVIIMSDYLNRLGFNYCRHDMNIVEPEQPKVMPQKGAYYRIVTRATDSDRSGRCIELLTASSPLITTYSAKGAAANVLWTNTQAKEGDANYDYQFWTFEESPSQPGRYALVCKALPDGSVNPTPTAQSNTGRWKYDSAKK